MLWAATVAALDEMGMLLACPVFFLRGLTMKNANEGDMVVVFWESARVRRQCAVDAFDQAGMAGLIPTVDYADAIRRAAVSAAETYCDPEEPAKYKVYSLPGRSNRVGCEVRRFLKGEKRNDLPFLFSLGAIKQDNGVHRIEMLDCECPNALKYRDKILDTANREWDENCGYVGASDLTQALNKLVRACHGVLLKDTGGVWHLPIDKAKEYLQIGASLAYCGVKLHSIQFNPKVNSELVTHVVDSLIERSTAAFTGIIDHYDELDSRGAKQRSNGRQSRMEEWVEWKATIDHNRQLLGKAFVALSKAGQKAYERIGEEAMSSLA